MELAGNRRRTVFLFLAPMLAVLVTVAAWPLVRTVYFGLTDASLNNLESAGWIGSRNYLDVIRLSSGRTFYSGLLADPAWWRAVLNTLRFAIISVFFETVFGLIIALVLSAEFRGRALVRAAVLLPWAIPTVVSAKMWAWMLNDQFGILNDLLIRLWIIDQPIAWTASPDTAFAAVLIVDIWKSTPFMALLILAGLQMLPSDIHEAARIDGAGPLKTFATITLPLLRPVLVVAILFRTLDALRIFDLIYVLTPSNERTRTMSVFVQENLFAFDKFGYGSAASTLLFLLTGLIAIAIFRAGGLHRGEGPPG